MIAHSDKVMTINNFDCKMIDKHQTEITTRVAESRLIAINMPK